MSYYRYLKPRSHGRTQQDIKNVPYEEMLPLRLRSFISGKGDGSKDLACLFEMSILFACLKDNDFQQQACSKEIDTFQSCFDNHLVDKKLKKQEAKSGEVAPGSYKMNYKKVNQVLKKYPPKYPLPPK